MNDNPWSALSFTVVLPPRGQARARHRIVNSHGKTFTTTYKDAQQQQDEEKLAALLMHHAPVAPLKGPIWLRIKAFMPIPQSKPKKWVADAIAGIVRPETKPDLSNIIKHLEDVMNGVFFVDDRQIVSLEAEKAYGDPARWEVSLLYRRDCQDLMSLQRQEAMA